MRQIGQRKNSLTVYRVVVAVIALGLVWQCSDNPVKPIYEPPRDLTKTEADLVSSGNSFGLKLFRSVAESEPGDNVFISPLSVAMALGMAYNGAAGETQTAMEETLELSGMSVEEINQSYRSLIDLLVNLDPDVAMQIANSIWYRTGFQVESEFLDVNRTHFDAEVAELDFASPEAVSTVNQWVDDATNGKIDKILQDIPPGMVMFLINAVYFKGTWTYQFDPNDTRDDRFRRADGTTIPCRMMDLTADFGRAGGEGVQIVDLPYGHEQFSMTIILPTEGTDLDSLIAELTPERWAEWIGSLSVSETWLQMPKFKLEYEKKLNKMLADMGMAIAFGMGADFSKITKGGGIFIDEVKHKTFVEVNEEGTEAAAVTSIGFTDSVTPPLRVDRPFIFAIRENHSGTILFIGKMMAPSAE